VIEIRKFEPAAYKTARERNDALSALEPLACGIFARSTNGSFGSVAPQHCQSGSNGSNGPKAVLHQAV